MESSKFNKKRAKESPKTIKIFAVMRLTILFLIASLFQATAIGFSQNTPVNIDAQSISLEQLFAEIEKQAVVKFLYRYESIAGKTVEVHANNMPVTTVLNTVLKSNELKYTLMDNNLIVVSPNEVNQLLGINGRVTDASGEPLAGVTISVPGTSIGTATDADGKFSLSVPDANSRLTFSYIGYLTQEITVGNQRNFQITLHEQLTEMDEVVVIGYGAVKKKDLTGSVGVVTLADMDRQPVIRIEDALKGKSTGVQITKQNAAPGAGMKIRIRGANSINGDNDPLYVIDGFVGGDFQSLNANEIETINILKDAAATAIYGSRGSNGVVLITTKQAKEGESRIEYNGFISWDKISKTLPVLTAAEYMQVANDREIALGASAIFSSNQIAEMERTGGTDWIKETMRTGVTQNHQLAITGGTPNARYYISGTYMNQDGIVINSFFRRYGLRSNINSKVGKKIDVGFNLYGTYTENRNNHSYWGRNAVMGQALVFPPNLPVIDPATSDYTLSPQGSYGPVAGNPKFAAIGWDNDQSGLNVLSNMSLAWTIMDGLKLSVSGGINIGSYDNPEFKRYGPGNSPATSEAAHATGQYYTYQNSNMLSFDKLFGGIHRIDASLVYEQQKYVSKSVYAYATGFPTIALTTNGIQLGATQTVSSGYTEWALQSFLGRVNYTLMDKYLLTLSGRYDGSSKFAKGNKYAFFPSAAVAWRISEEGFMKDMDVFQNLKLRASWGKVGSQAISPYKTMAKMRTDMEYFFDQVKYIGIGTSSPANPSLVWETTAQTNFGLDFGFLNGRLTGSLDYYYKKTTDLLFDVPIPNYNGGGSVTKNVGSLENKGFEIMLTGIIVDNRDFQLTTSANLSLNRNKILKLIENVDELLVNWSYRASSYNGYSVLKVGEPMGVYRGYTFDGVWKTAEADKALPFNRFPGDYKYKDINDDKKLNNDDMTIIGNSNPAFIWGWNTTAAWKNWDLSMYIYGIQGNDVWNFTRALITGHTTDTKVPTSREILNRWTPSNENTNIAGFSKTTGTERQSDQWIEKGSFARMGNLTLGYTFNNLIKNSFFRDAKIYVSSQNLFIITKYKGFDPESSLTPTSGDSYADKVQGFDDACYPPTRSFIFGIKFTF